MSFFSNQRDTETASLISKDDENESHSLSGSFIDDYSHLRLSYFQHRNGFNTSSDRSQSSGNTDEYTVNSNNTLDTHINYSEFDDMDTTSSMMENELTKNRIKEEYLEQMPTLPPPMFTVASMISSVTSKMKGNAVLKYHNVVEQPSGSRHVQDEIKFNPQRRSTLIPEYFRSHKRF